MACSLSSSDMCSVLVLVTISTLLAANTCNKGKPAVLFCKSWLTSLGYVEREEPITSYFCEMNNLIKIADLVDPKHLGLVDSEKEINRLKTSIWPDPERFKSPALNDRKGRKTIPDPKHYIQQGNEHHKKWQNRYSFRRSHVIFAFIKHRLFADKELKKPVFINIALKDRHGKVYQTAATRLKKCVYVCNQRRI